MYNRSIFMLPCLITLEEKGVVDLYEALGIYKADIRK